MQEVHAMDRQMLETHLKQTQSQITLGRRHIEQQLQRIVELEKHGHNTDLAMRSLSILWDTQKMHERDRKSILAQLSGSVDAWRADPTEHWRHTYPLA
jgi:hypothetical protein